MFTLKLSGVLGKYFFFTRIDILCVNSFFLFTRYSFLSENLNNMSCRVVAFGKGKVGGFALFDSQVLLKKKKLKKN